MLSYALRAFHIVLLLSGFYLLYGTVAPFIGSLSVSAISVPPLMEAERVTNSPDQYASISSRNLFRSQIEPPEAAPAPLLEETLEESSLSYRLLGTIAGSRPEYSIATVEDERTREHLHVRVNDPLGESGGVRVARIERKQLVIDNNGKLESILMDETTRLGQPSRSRAKPKGSSRATPRSRTKPRARARPSARSRARGGQTGLLKRVRSLSQARARAARGAEAKPSDQPGAWAADLLKQVQLAPSYTEEGDLDGISVTQVMPGTPLATAGLQAGDTIVSVNGVTVTGPSDLPKFRDALIPGQENCIETIGADGAKHSRCWGSE